MKSLENQQKNIMQTKSTLILLLAGAMAVTANATPSIGVSYASTEVGVAGSGFGGSTPANFGITSEAVDTHTTSGGLEVYEYEYTLPNLTSDPLSVFDVRFDSLIAGLVGVNGTANDGGFIAGTKFSMDWITPGPGIVTLDFLSTATPIIGQADAQDSGQWQDQDVVVPNAPIPPPPSTPDGGLTITLLGGSLMGLQALRRILAR
jgi:hypothetical protein